MPTSTEQRGSIRLTKLLERRLLDSVRERLPKKSFGFILSDGQNSNPTDFVSFEHNVRNSDLWRATFETYGKYFIDHDDAGFVADPRESWRIQQEIRNRGMREIGIFHSHLRHPANFTKIDMEMHLQCFEDLWHLIISMRNPAIPQLRVFRVCQRSVQELDWTYISETGAESSSDCGDTLGDSRDDVEEVLELDSADRPKCGDTRKIFRVVTALLRSKNKQVIKKYLTEGFCRHSQQRYHDYIAGDMAILPSVRFEMGTPLQLSNHFCGESPRHTVELSPFGIAKTPVTNEIFGLFSGRQCGLSEEERRKPVLGVTWFDAAVFALWMGCRLPSEAEWEFACGAGSSGDWCGGEETLLPQYAWYSDNSQGMAPPVATRAANLFGLFDLHGNVWEWCQDGYHQDYYARLPIVDPIDGDSIANKNVFRETHKVCRGGSFHALSEMCRTRYRLHEPPGFWAEDLGFRLAVNVDPTICE
jgi:sulfatase modifying factor 1